MLAVALFVVTLFLTLIQIRFLERRVTMSADAITLKGAEMSAEAGAEVTAARPGKRGRRIRIFGRYVALTVLAFIVLFPLYITRRELAAAATADLGEHAYILPDEPAVEHVRDAWNAGNMARYLVNSAVVTVIITVGQLAVRDLGRVRVRVLEFPFKRTLFVVFLATLMVPFEITIVTNLATMNDLGWYDTYQGLSCRSSRRHGVRRVPDAPGVPPGATGPPGRGGARRVRPLRFMTRVAVPLARPAIAALAVFAFLGAWNQYLWPLLVTKDDEYRTVQIGLKQLRATSLDQINVTFAGTVIGGHPARHPAAPLPEAAGARPHGRRRERLSPCHREQELTCPGRSPLRCCRAWRPRSRLPASPSRAPAPRRRQASPKCPLNALKKAKSKPVEITFWHSAQRANEETLQRLTERFNSSQNDVRVTLVNQTGYNDKLKKFRAGLSSGDLPDLVMIEDTGLQQMIDTQAVLPAQSCIKADKYDLSDNIKRVVDYYTVKGTLWPMPFNVSNPVLYYNKNAFQAAGLDPNNPPKTLDEVKAAAAEAQGLRSCLRRPASA